MGTFVIEIQDNAMLSFYHNEQETQSGVAKQDYYQKCGYACVSSVPRHVIILMTENGDVLQKEIFFHPTTPAETEEE